MTGPFSVQVMLADGTGMNLAPGELAPGADGRLRPVRKSSVVRGQPNMPGLWFSSVMRRHVGYESLLERNRMVLLDFAADTAGYLEQPLKLTYRAGGKKRVHTPDLLVWRHDGSLVLCNVKSSENLGRGSFPAQSEACAQFCELERIDYEVLTEPDRQVLENVRWLSGYWGVGTEDSPAYRAMLERLLDQPGTIGDLIEASGEHPVVSRPVLFSAIWSRRFSIDLNEPLSNDTKVWLTNAN